MEETKPKVPTPPQGLRKMPPPPPRPQGVGQDDTKKEENVVVEQQVQSSPAVEVETENVQENNTIEKSVQEEKPKQEKKSKSGILYWGGFVISLALIAFCIFMLIK